MPTKFIFTLSPRPHQQHQLSWLPLLLQESPPQKQQFQLPVCFATECFRAERLAKGQKDGSESQVRVSHCIFRPIVAKTSVESIARSLVIQWTIAARP
jgi:hypothetical protein